MASGMKTPHEEEYIERMRFEELYSGLDFTDDVNGGEILPKSEMIQARIEEIKFFRKMGVYRKVPKSWATGKPVISTRWVDTNKGTEECPQL